MGIGDWGLGIGDWASLQLGAAAILESSHWFFPVQPPACLQDATVTWTLTILIPY